MEKKQNTQINFLPQWKLFLPLLLLISLSPNSAKSWVYINLEDIGMCTNTVDGLQKGINYALNEVCKVSLGEQRPDIR